MNPTPKLFLLCGPNGAGKSTLTKKMRMRNNITVFDADEVAAKENLSPVGAGREAIKRMKDSLDKRESFLRESTLTANFDFKLCKDAHEIGYDVTLMYVGLDSMETSSLRVENRKREGGHSVPVKDIARRYGRSMENLRKMINIVDTAHIFCNSERNHREIATFKNRQIVFLSEEQPRWFENIFSDVLDVYTKHRGDLEQRGWHNDDKVHQDLLIVLRMRATGHSQMDIQMALALASPVRSVEHAAKGARWIFTPKGDEMLAAPKVQGMIERWRDLEAGNSPPSCSPSPRRRMR